MAEQKSPTAPTLTVPVAMVRLIPGAAAGHQALAVTASLADEAGIPCLGEHLFAVMPTARAGAVFEVAVRFARRIARQLRSAGQHDDLAGLLIHPGQVSIAGSQITPCTDPLLEDLKAHPPQLPPHTLSLTGYAAHWLRGRYRFEPIGLYEGSSGRRLPLVRLAGETAEQYPWHNVEIIGRQGTVTRPAVAAALATAIGNGDATSVRGPLGSGKSRAVWQALHERPGRKIWVPLSHALPGRAFLARRLIKALRQAAPQDAPAGATPVLRYPEAVPVARVAEILGGWLHNAAQASGAPLWIVCDDHRSARQHEQALIHCLLDHPQRGTSFKLILIGRSGGPAPAALHHASSLHDVEIPPMEEAELARCGALLFEGLAVDEAIQTRFLTAAAGLPFALEEGMVAMIHRRLIRQIYGNYFFDGGHDTEYEPSQRLVRFVESDLQRLGAPLPVRLLAVAGHPISAAHLADAAARLGSNPAPGWEAAYLEADWLQPAASPWGAALTLRCPAHAHALRHTLATDAITLCRQTLGRVLSTTAGNTEASWQAYRLLAGTSDSLPPLLQIREGSGETVSHETLYAALADEHQRHCDRGGDVAMELEILWSLLPLARKLGRLGEHRDSLDRALAHITSDRGRRIALLTLKAELDQEQGRAQEAEQGLREALALSEGSVEGKRALLFTRLGRLLVRQERLEEGREIFNNLLELADRDRPTAVGATCHFYLGNIALRERALEQARTHHEQALAVRRELSQLKSLGASLSALGAVHLAIGDYPNALAYYRQAEERLTTHGEEGELSYALLGLGRASGQLGDHTAAAAPLRRALALRAGRDDVTGEAITRLALAANLVQIGNSDDALQEARRAFFHLSLLPETSLLGHAEELLGRILLKRREAEEARQHFDEALRIHLQVDDLEAVAVDHRWLIALGLQVEDEALVRAHCNDLGACLGALKAPAQGERLHLSLYLGLDWLRRRGRIAVDPVVHLRQAYAELMRKTRYLAPALRSRFLFHIEEHEAIIDAATEAGLTAADL